MHARSVKTLGKVRTDSPHPQLYENVYIACIQSRTNKTILFIYYKLPKCER